AASVSLLAAAAVKLKQRIAPYVYGEDDADLAAVVLDMCRSRKLTIAVAESCTGGMLGQRLTAIPGASEAFIGGIIAYDDDVKRMHLDVGADLIAMHGAVSIEVAAAMASGVRRKLGAGIGMAITGIAGPGGGTAEKPVGTVCLAIDGEGVSRSKALRLIGDRGEIR